MSTRDDIEALRAASRAEFHRMKDADENISLKDVMTVVWDAIYVLADAIDGSERDGHP